MRFQNTIAQSIEANDYTATRFLPERGHRMKEAKEKKNDGETDSLPMRRNASFPLMTHAFFKSDGHATVRSASQRGHRMNKDAKNRNKKQRFPITVEMCLSL